MMFPIRLPDHIYRDRNSTSRGHQRRSSAHAMAETKSGPNFTLRHADFRNQPLYHADFVPELGSQDVRRTRTEYADHPTLRSHTRRHHGHHPSPDDDRHLLSSHAAEGEDYGQLMYSNWSNEEVPVHPRRHSVHHGPSRLHVRAEETYDWAPNYDTSRQQGNLHSFLSQNDHSHRDFPFHSPPSHPARHSSQNSRRHRRTSHQPNDSSVHYDFHGPFPMYQDQSYDSNIHYDLAGPFSDQPFRGRTAGPSRPQQPRPIDDVYDPYTNWEDDLPAATPAHEDNQQNAGNPAGPSQPSTQRWSTHAQAGSPPRETHDISRNLSTNSEVEDIIYHINNPAETFTLSGLAAAYKYTRPEGLDGVSENTGSKGAPDLSRESITEAHNRIFNPPVPDRIWPLTTLGQVEKFLQGHSKRRESIAQLQEGHDGDRAESRSAAHHNSPGNTPHSPRSVQGVSKDAPRPKPYLRGGGNQASSPTSFTPHDHPQAVRDRILSPTEDIGAQTERIIQDYERRKRVGGLQAGLNRDRDRAEPGLATAAPHDGQGNTPHSPQAVPVQKASKDGGGNQISTPIPSSPHDQLVISTLAEIRRQIHTILQDYKPLHTEECEKLLNDLDEIEKQASTGEDWASTLLASLERIGEAVKAQERWEKAFFAQWGEL